MDLSSGWEERKEKVSQKSGKRTSKEAKNAAIPNWSNTVNSEPFPDNFDYIVDLIYHESCQPFLNQDVLLVCDCKVACHTRACDHISYQPGGKLLQGKLEDLCNRVVDEIVECNLLCACPPGCPNRVVQKSHVFEPLANKLEVFRTEMCGWGLKTNKRIAPGTYVCSYVGEVVHEEEVKRRLKGYQKVVTTV